MLVFFTDTLVVKLQFYVLFAPNAAQHFRTQRQGLLLLILFQTRGHYATLEEAYQHMQRPARH